MNLDSLQRGNEIAKSIKELSDKKKSINIILNGYDSGTNFLGENGSTRVRFYDSRNYQEVNIKMDVNHIKDGMQLELARTERKIKSLEKEFESL